MVNVSSLAAVQPFESWGMYCAGRSPSAKPWSSGWIFLMLSNTKTTPTPTRPGKAARDMFTSVVAKEQQADANAAATTHKTLNFAPGPLETDMQTELRESATLHPPTREWSLEAFKAGTLIKPGDSAAKCIQTLAADRFESGAHVDYYDKEDA